MSKLTLVIFYDWFTGVYLLFGVGKRYNIYVIYGNIRVKGIKTFKSSMVCPSIYVLV